MTKEAKRSLLAVTTLVMTLCQLSAGEEPKAMKHGVDRLTQIRTVYEDNTLSDSEAVNALVRLLDDSISDWKVAKAEGLAPSSWAVRVHARNSSMLIAMIAERQFPAKPPGRPKAVAEALKTLNDRKNVRELRSYLNVSLAYAGGVASDRELLEVLGDSDTPKEIVAVTLEAFDRSHVPIESLPDLMRLSQDPWWTVADTEGVGHTPVPRRVYPVRENACLCLRRLGIRCEKTLVEDSEPDLQWHTHLATVINVDRGSLLNKIKRWLLDDNESVWQAAASVVVELDQADVWRAVGELKTSGLPVKKLNYIERKRAQHKSRPSVPAKRQSPRGGAKQLSP